MTKARVLWLSRHQMTEEQADDLLDEATSGWDGLDIETENHLWSATASEEADMEENSRFLKSAFARADIVAGVFPPVALEALRQMRREFRRRAGSDPFWCVATPVSEQTREERADGTAQITFRHVRWAFL